jgi:choline dehydrogenase-like flavoprotein
MAMSEDMIAAIRDLADVGGLRIEDEAIALAPAGRGIHETGTARMGDDASTSVLNPWNQVWEVENLFVVDGAAFVSAGPQNPTLTMMALALRAADHIAERHRRGG